MPFYLRLGGAGKPGKVAVVAAMRKLVLILNAMLKTNTAWRLYHVPPQTVDRGPRCLEVHRRDSSFDPRACGPMGNAAPSKSNLVAFVHHRTLFVYRKPGVQLEKKAGAAARSLLGRVRPRGSRKRRAHIPGGKARTVDGVAASRRARIKLQGGVTARPRPMATPILCKPGALEITP